MIDTSRKTTPDFCQGCSRNIELKQEPVTESDNRKVDLSIMSFSIRYFATQFYTVDTHKTYTGTQ